jgi:hypothetical protein
MLASINPLGERARNMQWMTTVTWYVAGSVLGGGALGAVSGEVGYAVHAAVDPSPAVIAAIVAVACLVALLFDLHVAGLRLPTVHRQVNEDWLTTYRGWLYGLGFGFQLGLGVVTIVTTAAVYLVVVLCALSGSIVTGAAIGMTFGAVRAVPVLMTRGVREPAQLRTVVQRVETAAPLATRAVVGVLALCVAIAAIATFTA